MAESASLKASSEAIPATGSAKPHLVSSNSYRDCFALSARRGVRLTVVWALFSKIRWSREISTFDPDWVLTG